MPIRRLRLAWSVLALSSAAPALAQGGRHPVIVIDPGHPSEVSNGATIQNGTSEVHVAWRVAQRLGRLLTAYGYSIKMTKSSERQTVTNVARAEIGNRARAALVVRLHCDASSDSGYAVYFPDRTGTAQGRTGLDAQPSTAGGWVARGV
jgi:N-acetylmuramoyl-L-alanine amidase